MVSKDSLVLLTTIDVINFFVFIFFSRFINVFLPIFVVFRLFLHPCFLLHNSMLNTDRCRNAGTQKTTENIIVINIIIISSSNFIFIRIIITVCLQAITDMFQRATVGPAQRRVCPIALPHQRSTSLASRTARCERTSG